MKNGGNHGSDIKNRIKKTKRREQKHNTKENCKTTREKRKRKGQKRNTKLMGKQGLKWQ